MIFCNFSYSELLFVVKWYNLSMNFFPKISQKYLCDDSLILYLLILLALLVVMDYTDTFFLVSAGTQVPSLSPEAVPLKLETD